METVELVIRLPKKVYDTVMKKERMLIEDDIEIYKAIDNGTPLPKGHGDLVDANTIKYEEENNENGKCTISIKATKVVEADEEGAEDAEEMDKDEKTNSIKMVRSASVSLSKALNAIRPIIMGTNLYFRHKGYESTLRYALDDIEGILEELEGGSKEE